MKYVGFALDELQRALFALREDGAVYVIQWRVDRHGDAITEPSVALVARLPSEEPPDSAAV